jgi:uncharacterized protein (TIGR00266 family)
MVAGHRTHLIHIQGENKTMSPWYLIYDGRQEGPYDTSQARQRVRSDSNGHAWREGYADWVPISRVAELMEQPGGIPAPPSARRGADDIDFRIVGSEMQFVEIELDPGESVVAEAGAMMYKDAGITMEAIFGDASTQGGSLTERLFSAGKRLLTGETLFMTLFTHTGQGKGRVAFAAPYPGNIIPVTLASLGGTLICQKDCFLCAARGVSIGIYFQRRILTGLFGGEGFIMQKLEGDGLAFLHAGGTIVERALSPGEPLHVDTGCLVAMEPTVSFDIQQAGNIKTALFGGEGLFFARLSGPGRVWLQSLPFSRLAGRMLQAVPQRGGNKDEGSLLGSLGTLIGGDRR